KRGSDTKTGCGEDFLHSLIKALYSKGFFTYRMKNFTFFLLIDDTDFLQNIRVQYKFIIYSF
ncbi:hypothetical protein OCF92_17530, partial [Bacillus cereus]|nr:hypothetical protein [Bacillus cereus]